MARRAKIQPLGICDFCRGNIPRGEWYTSKGKPRLHCSITCRQTDNSRIGAPIRSKKAKARVRAGVWVNPRSLMTAEEISAAQSHASRKGRLREVKEGRWRNPALTEAARKKLSRPRKHRGRLHKALETLREVGSMRALPDDLRKSHNRYRRKLARQNREQRRAWYRDWYKKRQAQMTPKERERQRAKWRAGNRRKQARGYKRPK